MIFAFHRVLDDPDPILPTEPDAARFKTILEWIGSLCNVLPLVEATEALQRGHLPARAAAITFDDGYRNNLVVAKPILASAGLPATVFIAANAVRDGIMWNDLVIESLRCKSDVDLSGLSLPGLTDVADRLTMISRVIAAIKYRAPRERWQVASDLFRRLSADPPPRLMLTEDEVRLLGGNGIDLGAHTMNHPILSRESDDVARAEIVESRAWLSRLVGRSIDLFAYPNGAPGVDYYPVHAQMVRSAGFGGAVTTRWGAATRASDVFELPRFTPWEREEAKFAKRVVKVCARSYV